MIPQYTPVIERDGEWFIATCSEVPGANGQGKNREECLASLREAVVLVLEVQKEDARRLSDS